MMMKKQELVNLIKSMPDGMVYNVQNEDCDYALEKYKVFSVVSSFRLKAIDGQDLED